MNFLAHAWLADQCGSSLAGNIMGDFVRGRLEDRFPLEIRRGIHLHRAVDAFTNDHPATARAIDIFTGHRRLIAAIVLDIANDHFLASTWSCWHREPLPDFTARVYKDLQAQPQPLPGRLDWMADVMRDEDLLAGYADPEQFKVALERTAYRLKDPSAMAGTAEVVLMHRDYLYECFEDLLPDVRDHAWKIYTESAHG